MEPVSSLHKTVALLLHKGNLPQAEIYLRSSLESDPKNAKTLNILGCIASAIGEFKVAKKYFSQSSLCDPNWPLPRENLNSLRDENRQHKIVQSEKYLIIKAWGYGFWSDVSHLLGQLLIAEITNRIPVVHWGENSLFGGKNKSNAFDFYFEQLSDTTIDDIHNNFLDIYPPKWNKLNLYEGEVNKWTGPYSRLAGLYLLNRPEVVVVSDFYSGVVELIPWIPPEHHLSGLSIDEIYRYLALRYLHPKSSINDQVDEFYHEYLASSEFIAVHVRGSDKSLEVSNLDEINEQYQKIIDKVVEDKPGQLIFLMTDDSLILRKYIDRYGSLIVATDSQRTNTTQGIHYQSSSDKVKLGCEVMMDVCLALKANTFIGNASSNPSQAVKYMKDWPKENIIFFGEDMYHKLNPFLHNW